MSFISFNPANKLIFNLSAKSDEIEQVKKEVSRFIVISYFRNSQLSLFLDIINIISFYYEEEISNKTVEKIDKITLLDTKKVENFFTNKTDQIEIKFENVVKTILLFDKKMETEKLIKFCKSLQDSKTLISKVIDAACLAKDPEVKAGVLAYIGSFNVNNDLFLLNKIIQEISRMSEINDIFWAYEDNLLQKINFLTKTIAHKHAIQTNESYIMTRTQVLASGGNHRRDKYHSKSFQAASPQIVKKIKNLIASNPKDFGYTKWDQTSILNQLSKKSSSETSI